MNIPCKKLNEPANKLKAEDVTTASPEAIVSLEASELGFVLPACSAGLDGTNSALFKGYAACNYCFISRCCSSLCVLLYHKKHYSAQISEKLQKKVLNTLK